ncbi:MAG: signal recognition particle-docking protein FtsY [Rhizobiaceae bacterium]|nr:signal recognition particle-docking protein FtsY [Rhizobiaceae bacterium]
MALGFIKKVFSFGRKPAEEAPPPEDAPLAPLNLDALKRFVAEAEPKPAASDPVEAMPPAAAQTEPEVPAPPVEPEPAPLVESIKPAFEAGSEAEAVTPSSPLEWEVPEHRAEGVVDEVHAVPSLVEFVDEAASAQALGHFVELQPGSAASSFEPRPDATMAPEVAPEPAAQEEHQDSPAPPIPPNSRNAPHPLPDLLPVKDGEKGTGGAADASLSPPLRAEGKGEGLLPPAATAALPAGSPAQGKVTVSRAVEAKRETAPVPSPPEPRKSWFQRLRDGLSRSSRELTGSISGIFTKRKLDEETLEELEDVLIRADLGVETALRVTDTLASSRYGKDVSDAEVRAIMAQEVEKVLTPVALPLELDLSHKPHVILVVGVNGTGKTTTIGKLAAKLTAGGLSVMLAAGDTFRAAAIEQLKIWGERTKSPVVSSKLGADAAGLAWDAFEKAKAAGSDVLIIDTAGRLQNKAELMAELEKIVRVLGKHDPEAPHTVLQTVDATTGQNALNQVEIFRNVAGVNGLVMTKLDGTARGGILVAIAAKHRLPVYFIGVGEQVDDLEPFSAGDFAKAIAGVG